MTEHVVRRVEQDMVPGFDGAVDYINIDFTTTHILRK